MNWLRCPKCRTKNSEITHHCFGCGARLGDAPRRSAAPAVEQDAARDRKSTHGFILAMAVLGGVGIVKVLLILAATQRSWILPAGAVLLGMGVVGALLLAKRGDPQFDEAGRVVVVGLAVVGIIGLGLAALGVGLLILLLVVCAGKV
jgi:hypothetical protein